MCVFHIDYEFRQIKLVQRNLENNVQTENRERRRSCLLCTSLKNKLKTTKTFWFVFHLRRTLQLELTTEKESDTGNQNRCNLCPFTST